MANSIDLATLAVGACIGYGLKKEIRSAGTIARNALLAGIAGAAVTAAAQEEKSKAESQANGEKKDGN